MNAYELADSWNKIGSEKEMREWSATAYTMLRQQAEKINNMEIWEKKYLDRIEELEKDLHMLQRHYDQLYHDLPNPKPVAYVNWNTGTEISMDFLPAVLFHKLIIENRDDYIPLYTTPQTKSKLNDSEIETIGKEYGIDSIYRFAYYEFARAIEAKVRGEK